MPNKHASKGEGPLDESPSRDVANRNKPPMSKTAWTHQETRESIKKNHRTEKETKVKSQRQRTYSEVENIAEIRLSSSKNVDNHKRKNNSNPSFSRCKSEERLDYRGLEEKQFSERSGNSALSDDNNSIERSKSTSREAVVKSQKPTTKPLLLGKCFCSSCAKKLIKVRRNHSVEPISEPMQSL